MAKNITPTWRLCLTSGGFSRSVSAAWRRPGGSPDAEPIGFFGYSCYEKKHGNTMEKIEKPWENHGKNMKNNGKTTIVHGQIMDKSRINHLLNLFL